MKRFFLIIGLLVSMSAFAQESNDTLYKKAYSLWVADRDAEAFPLFRQLAEAGDKRGERVMGQYYHWGYTPVEKNYALAYEWYKKAADQGDGVALNNIGWMYEEGQYVTQSKERAFEYYMKASDAGNGHGSVNVGRMYWDNHFDYWGYEEEATFPPVDSKKNYATIPDYHSYASAGGSGKPSMEETNNTKDSTNDKNRKNWEWKETIHEDESYVQSVVNNNGQLNLDVIPTSPAEEFFLKAAKQDSAYGMYWLARFYDWHGCDDNFMTFRLDYGNYRKLNVLFSISAKNGNANAQAMLGSY